MSKQLIIKKILLKAFLEVLNDIYESGADFVDLIGTPDEHEDAIGISVPEEYMNTGEQKEEEENSSLTDDDINQLI